MNPKTIVLTGASDGIGAAAARKLIADGHTVALVGRSQTKTVALASELNADYFLADFSDLAEVHTLVTALKHKYPRIDVLANNAGGIFGEQGRTVDGFEKTLQVNHLAPFLLTNLLMDTLIHSKATIVNTASAAARIFGNIDVNDLENEVDFSPNKAYGDAKLANILFTKELMHRFGMHGIAAAAFHPGLVRTNFASDTTSFMRFIYQSPLAPLFGLITPEKGSRTLTWLVESEPGKAWQPGEYYEKKKVSKTNPQAADRVLASALWDRSAEIVGLGSSD